MELTPAVMDIILAAARPQIELTARFKKACGWLTDDDKERYDLASDWYYRTLRYVEIRKISIEHVMVMNGLVGLAERFGLDDVLPYLERGCDDLEMVARSIEEDIDYDLLISLRNGSNPAL